MNDILKPGDIFFTRGTGFISRAIRFLTRSFGESRTVANHVGVIVTEGEGLLATGVEALSRVREHLLIEQYGNGKSEICVFRPKNLTPKQRQKIVARAESFVNRKYGYLKIVLHLLDWFLLGAYVFRRLGRMDKYPICSYVVASAFKAAGKNFGVSNYAASPDDILDFCVREADKYRFVWQKGTMIKWEKK